jgi:hypothetical protein
VADAAVTGQAEVEGCELADPQAAKVVLDALAQLVRIAEREDGTAVGSPDGDLADNRQPVGIGEERTCQLHQAGAQATAASTRSDLVTESSLSQALMAPANPCATNCAMT